MSVDLRPGDCLDVLRSMEPGSVDAVVTDPPYGIDYGHGGAPVGRTTRSTVQVEWGHIAGDEKPDGAWLPEAYRVLRDGAALYLCTRWDVEPEWRTLLRAAGFTVKQRLTWHKRVSGKGDLKGTYSPTCEDVIFATKGRHVLARRLPMLLDVGCVPTWERRLHPHQKPVALPERLILNSTKPGDVVCDPFMGSGTTAEACILTGRDFIGVEIDPAHFAIAETRISAATEKYPLIAG